MLYSWLFSSDLGSSSINYTEQACIACLSLAVLQISDEIALLLQPSQSTNPRWITSLEKWNFSSPLFSSVGAYAAISVLSILPLNVVVFSPIPQSAICMQVLAPAVLAVTLMHIFHHSFTPGEAWLCCEGNCYALLLLIS